MIDSWVDFVATVPVATAISNRRVYGLVAAGKAKHARGRAVATRRCNVGVQGLSMTTLYQLILLDALLCRADPCYVCNGHWWSN